MSNRLSASLHNIEYTQVNTIYAAAENIPKSLRQYIVRFTTEKDFLTLTVFRVNINTSSSLEKPFQWRAFLIRQITGKSFVDHNSTVRRTLLEPINYIRPFICEHIVELCGDSLRVGSLHWLSQFSKLYDCHGNFSSFLSNMTAVEFNIYFKRAAPFCNRI